MAKFSIGVRPSKSILKALLEIDNGEIDSLYGSSPNIVPLPSAREPSRLSTTTLEEFKAFIKECHDNDWKFSYTINGKCLGQGIPKETLKEYFEILMRLHVDSVTVSNVYLIELIRKFFGQQLQIKVSTIAEPNSIRDITSFRKYYPTVIVLSSSCNRDFNFLEHLQDKSDIELMANEVCLYECPWRADHYNIEGHGDTSCYEGFPLKNCFKAQMNDYTEFLKARFIRPEDIFIYENMGYNQFKITGRSCTDAKVVQMTSAYLERFYDGNMLDLFPLVTGDLANEKTTQQLPNIPNKFMDKFLLMYPSKLNKNHRCDVACGNPCDYCSRYLKYIEKASHIATSHTRSTES